MSQAFVATDKMKHQTLMQEADEKNVARSTTFNVRNINDIEKSTRVDARNSKLNEKRTYQESTLYLPRKFSCMQTYF